MILPTLKSIRSWKQVLPAFLAILTQHPRYLPEIVWSEYWTHNFFRVYELIFWRRYGVRLESRTFNGKTTNFTLEARIAYFESCLRDRFAWLWGRPSIYPGFAWERGAIAFDAATQSSSTSFNHTVTGSNTVLMVGYFGNTVAGTITGYTFNSVAMTSINDQAVNGGTQHVGLFYQIAPTGSTHSVARQGTDSSGNTVASSYTGCSQSSQPDASNKAQASAGSVSLTLTTVADNSWAVCHVRGDADDGRANNSGVTTTSRGGDTYFWDSNGALTPAGGKTVSISGGSSQGWGLAAASIAPPSAAVATTTASGSLLLMGIGN